MKVHTAPRLLDQLSAACQLTIPGTTAHAAAKHAFWMELYRLSGRVS